MSQDNNEAASADLATVSKGASMALPALPTAFATTRRIDGSLCNVYSLNQMHTYATTYGAQQREAGRLEGKAESDKWYGICMNTAGVDAPYTRIAELKSALSRQPVSGLTDERALLQQFVDYHSKPAGLTLDTIKDRACFGAFLEDIEVREKEMVAKARALLATPPNKGSEDETTVRAHIAWARDTLRETGHCIDGGKCHHGCAKKASEPCWRKDSGGCLPLTGSRLSNDWTLPAVKGSEDDKRDAEPDLLWDADDPEDGVHGDSAKDFAEAYASAAMSAGETLFVEVLCATRSHKRTMRITVGNDDDEKLEWEWVDAARAVPQSYQQGTEGGQS